MKQLRVFYNLSGDIIGLHGLEGSGNFIQTIEEQIEKLPMGTKCITMDKTDQIDAFLMSKTNTIVDDQIIIGPPRPIVPMPESKTLTQEINELKARITSLESKVII